MQQENEIVNSIESQQLKRLLANVHDISDHHHDVLTKTGEGFNIFNALRLKSDELSHSLFIGYLLNVNASHGQKNLFLRSFIEVLKEKYQNDLESQIQEGEVSMNQTRSHQHQSLIHFDTQKSRIWVEYGVGNVDLDDENGGRLDLYLSDGPNKFVIENKIYANDQPKQLLRYKKFVGNQPIVYLCLFKDNFPSDGSIGRLENNPDSGLVEGLDFIIVSYEIDIINWLEKCVKEVYDKPLIRETINQYLSIIRSLSNQINTKAMSTEISKLILSNENHLKAFISSIQSIKQVKDEVFDEFAAEIKCIADKYQLDVNIKLKSTDGWPGFTFKNDVLSQNNLKIGFGFNNKQEKQNLIFGFIYDNIEIVNDHVQISNKFKVEFKSNGTFRGSKYWMGFFEYKAYPNWENWDFIVRLKFEKPFRDELLSDIEYKIKKMLEMV